MSKIEELIDKLCPDGVKYRKIEDVAIIKRGDRITKRDLKEEGSYKVISGGVEPMGYYDEYNRDEKTITISSYGYAGYVSFIEEKFWANDVCLCVFPNDIVNNKYLYYSLKNMQEYFFSKTTKAIPDHIPTEIIKETCIPVPPLEVQCEIVHILDNFTLLSAELSAELKARQKQYEFYSKNLFDFNDEVDWVNLEFIAEIGTGSSNTNEAVENGKYPFYVRSQQVYYKNDYEYDDNSIITSGDGVGVGKIFHYTNGKYALHQRAYRIHIIDSKVNSKYFYYYMKSTFYDYIQKNAFNSSVTSIRRPMLNKYPIPVPSLEKQNKVVDILDRFDKLCNDISEGLPAEIEARQKQYEYYRDKLLTFKELKVNE